MIAGYWILPKYIVILNFELIERPSVVELLSVWIVGVQDLKTIDYCCECNRWSFEVMKEIEWFWIDKSNVMNYCLSLRLQWTKPETLSGIQWVQIVESNVRLRLRERVDQPLRERRYGS